MYWKTANEINVSRFEIQRSVDARIFTHAGNVAANNNNQSSIYQFNDNVAQNSPLRGVGGLFYRLKMIDIDGHFTYSPIISIKNRSSENGFVLGENPVKGKLLINAVNASLLHTEASFVNSSGVIVKRFTITGSSQTVNVSDLPPGVYYIHTQQGSSKVVIER